ncbi:MAG: hypothetical protein GC150_08705 [Rhizobiales bacterium]|nr:hypothetical protein [Hyphomicrobiales bacterium]
MVRVGFVLVWFLSMFAVAPAWADSGGLDGAALKRALSGKTLRLSTPLGTMPIRYRANGTMVGEATTVLVSYTGSRKDRGSWWVSGDQLCQRWSKWEDGQAYCFSFRKEGNTVHWRRSDGRSGTAHIVN